MTKVVGIWDVESSAGSLGLLLILLEELRIQCQAHDADSAEIVLVNGAQLLLDASTAASSLTDKNAQNPAVSKRLSSMLPVLRAMSGITTCHVCADSQSLANAAALLRSNCVVWPDPRRLASGAYNYDSTRFIQDYFENTGSIPRLSVVAERLESAKRYLRSRSSGRRTVAAHLKNNPDKPGQSNANPNAWLEFIAGCEHDESAHFFLIGDDTDIKKFGTLRNVTIAINDGLRLEDYLALIQASDLFMGMMSGPANMALFGTAPYAIFKNPDHHAAEMFAEIGNADRYPFALDNQRVLRQWDSVENLRSAFENAIALGTPQ